MNTDNNNFFFLKKLWWSFSYIVVSEGVFNAHFWEVMTRKDRVQSHVCCIEIFSTKLTCTSLSRACPIHGPFFLIWASSLKYSNNPHYTYQLYHHLQFHLHILPALYLLIRLNFKNSSIQNKLTSCCLYSHKGVWNNHLQERLEKHVEN